MSKFSIGDEVQWTSSSAGTTVTKVGKVETVLAARERMSERQRKESDASGLPRDHESYLVRVPGRTGGAKGKLYWPRVAALSLADSAGARVDEIALLRGLLNEVRAAFTRDDDLPDNLLPRIDEALDATASTR